MSLHIFFFLVLGLCVEIFIILPDNMIGIGLKSD